MDKFNKNSAVSDTVTAEVEITHTETETGEVALLSTSALFSSTWASLDWR